MFKKLCTVMLCIGLTVVFAIGVAAAPLYQTAAGDGGYVPIVSFEFNDVEPDDFS